MYLMGTGLNGYFQHLTGGIFGIAGELALPCLVAWRPLESVTLQGRTHIGIGYFVEEDLQAVFFEVVDHLAAIERNLTIFTACPFLLLFPHLADEFGILED